MVASTDCNHADDSGGRRVSTRVKSLRMESAVVIWRNSVGKKKILFLYLECEPVGGRSSLSAVLV